MQAELDAAQAERATATAEHAKLIPVENPEEVAARQNAYIQKMLAQSRREEELMVQRKAAHEKPFREKITQNVADAAAKLKENERADQASKLRNMQEVQKLMNGVSEELKKMLDVQGGETVLDRSTSETPLADLLAISEAYRQAKIDCGQGHQLAGINSSIQHIKDRMSVLGITATQE